MHFISHSLLLTLFATVVVVVHAGDFISEPHLKEWHVELQETAMMTVTPHTELLSGQSVEVRWSGVQHADASDFIAVYCPYSKE
jgi:hypothetical protein